MLSRIVSMSRMAPISRFAHRAAVKSLNFNQPLWSTRDIKINAQTRKLVTESYKYQNIEAKLGSNDSYNSDKDTDEVNYSPRLTTLETNFTKFEQRSQLSERVTQVEFVQIFDEFTKLVQHLDSTNALNDRNLADLTLISNSLLRCCGKLMYETPPKVREMLAGNLWVFLKEKNLIQLDITHYNCLIKVMNENNTTFDPKKILEEISLAKLKPDRVTYQRLIHQYCLQGNVAEASNILENMKELGMPLNEFTFASLIIGYGKQEKPPTLDEMLDLMRNSNVEVTGTVLCAMITSIADRLKHDPAACMDELKKLKNIAEEHDVIFNSLDITDMIDSLIPVLDKDPVVVHLYEKICLSNIKTMGTRYRVMSALIRNGQFEKASEIYWSVKPSQKQIESGRCGIPYIRLLVGAPNEFALKECSKLNDMRYNSKAFYYLYQYSGQEGNLSLLRQALLKISEDMKLKCHFYWPLLAQAKNEADIVHVLKHDLNPSMDSRDLNDTFTQWVWPKFEDNIMRLFELNKEQLHYDNTILVTSLLNYSLASEKLSPVIKFLTEAPADFFESSAPKTAEATEDQYQREDGDGIVDVNQRRRRETNNNLGRILNSIAEQTKDPKLVKKAYEMCRRPGSRVGSKDLQALVRVHIDNNDYESAIKTLLELAEKEKVTPCKNELMAHCLEKKDSETLQKIMNVSTEIYGESNSLYDLAQCCLLVNKVRQAQKIFVSPGFRVNPERVYHSCRLLAAEGKVEPLENLIRISRHLYDLNKDYLYEILLECYEKTSNCPRILDLWNSMQEDEFQPSRKVMNLIAEVLERNNMDVPFQKPNNKPEE